ncbi:acetyl-CoA carboxylase carboxyl transferase subunit alpha [Umezawaea sp.]|uniref:acetyl-CoA carboxylase carboxyl transferase subunit alpha n=1 Tax=Umezawaea sp. TaxID=1955258 RepID=UPI002ED15D62
MTAGTRATARREPGAEDWFVCPECRAVVYRKRYDRLLRVCSDCGAHGRLDPRERVAQLLDEGYRTVPLARTQHDPLGFVDQHAYPDRLTRAVASTGEPTAVRVVRGRVEGAELVAAVMDFRFLGGSLGVAEGEAITTAAETALAARVPLLLVTASGGARMQEGVLSLMQMAKTSGAMAELDRAGLLTVSLITDPTYGGVAASFATLSDVVVAEPRARMGFAGPRVIEQTIGQELPKGFQTADFLLDHGAVDAIWARSELRVMLARLLATRRGPGAGWGVDVVDPVIRDPEALETRPAWETVLLARDPRRPTALDHIGHWLDGFVELRGDRLGADCPSVVGGIGGLDGQPVVVIGHQKGHTTRELVARRFGMPSPAGYRKAARLMRLAAKLGLPVVTLVDTPGAHPGVEAEEQGQAMAIAENLRLMCTLPVPIVTVVTGEGGSGGALALGVADRVLMCANTTYSVISPEGCAAILWKSASAASVAAEALRIDGRWLLASGVVDGVVPEPDGGAQENPSAASELVRRAVVCALRELRGVPSADLISRRGKRFRRYGLSFVDKGSGDE